MKRKGHETKRCFPTKCRLCDAKVLFWESVAGAKVFFNLPIYGKLQRHSCKSSSNKRKTLVLETHSEHLKKKQLKQNTYQCPVCGKIFEKELYLNKHIMDLKNFDDSHSDFFENILDFLNWEDNEEKKSFFDSKSPFKQKIDDKTTNDRFIFKSKNKEDYKKFEKLIRRKRNN